MRVLISGGGTGGHLFPAIAVAQALSRKEPDAAVLFAGRREGIEARTVASYGMPFAAIPAAPFYTEQLWRNWTLPAVLGAALYQSWRLLDRFKPDVVLGTGGYVSVPLITAAGLARVPIVLQEQNLMPGRATRVLARFARTAARYQPFAFASDLADRIRVADLIISRAGASTLSEVSAIGVPMILVPYPYAGGHQRLNVNPYASAGAAIVIPDEEVAGRLRGVLTSVIDDAARYRKMVEAMRGLGRPYAAEEIVRLLHEAARRH